MNSKPCGPTLSSVGSKFDVSEGSSLCGILISKSSWLAKSPKELEQHVELSVVHARISEASGDTTTSMKLKRLGHYFTVLDGSRVVGLR
jgi:hypothetical protein